MKSNISSPVIQSKKLFQSHSSIYEALNNPDLNRSITPDFSEWQEASKIPSIISLSEDEEEELRQQQSELLPSFEQSQTLTFDKITILSPIEINSSTLFEISKYVQFEINPDIVSTELVFVINNGTKIDKIEGNKKVIIVNLIGTNYFNNLFTLINDNVPPYQIWKIKEMEELKDKMAIFINEKETEISFDYKLIELKYLNDLQNIMIQPDPLNLNNYVKNFISFCVGVIFGLGIGGITYCLNKNEKLMIQEMEMEMKDSGTNLSEVLFDLSMKLIDSIKSGLNKFMILIK
ncbi:unnamed protein product [Candida verbasci]|uniref:Uncharacterized protein n=1 Tax=Candida verbasci TaxID=1227364 RepID=A0A9W4TRX9_9ASCO|nr:unnamed protein product [Candida verbasci]